jgi:mono/diheme cytochrome c family protein
MPAKERLLLTAVILLGLSLLVVACVADTGRAELATMEIEPAATEDVSTAEPAGLFGGQGVEAAYLDSCSGCHGRDRRGATGPALLAQRMSQDDAYYFDVIKNGKPGTIMPPWGHQYSDEEVSAMVAFIRSETEAEAERWTMEDVRATLTVINAEGDLPDEPNFDFNLDNLMLVTE